MDQPASGFNLNQLLRAYDFNLEYAKDLVRDVTDEQLYQAPGPGLENHPGFALGHLVMASALIAKYLGGVYDVPEGWEDFFHRAGPGDPTLPVSDSPDLPAKDELIDELERQHGIVREAVLQCAPEKLESPVEWRFDQHFPTAGDMLTFMCITHEAMHLAQVAAWRRALGLESSLGRL